MIGFTIRGRLITVVLLSLLPVVLLGYLFLAQSQKDIAFAAREAQGNSYIAALVPDLVAMVGGKQLPDAAVLAKISESFDTDLGTATESASYLKLRPSVVTSGFSMEASRAVLSLIAKVADGSNLTLDPDLDSFYVMDMLTTKVPSALDAGGKIVTRLDSAKEVGGATEDLRIELVSSLGAFSDRVEGLNSSFSSALAGNDGGTVSKNLKDDVTIFVTKASEFSALAKAAIAQVGTNSAAFDIAGETAAMQDLAVAAGRLAAATSTELARLLQARIDGLTSRLEMMLGAAAALVLLTFAVSAVFANSILRTMKRLEQDIRGIAQHETGTTIRNANGRDEISAIARAVVFLRDHTVERLKALESLKAQEQENAAQVERSATAARESDLRRVAEAAAAQQEAVSVLSHSLAQLASGNLGCKIEQSFGADLEGLRVAFNGTVESLTQIVGQLNETSGGVRSATGEILAGSNDLADRTSKQAAAIEETSASMEQLAQTVSANAERANSASLKSRTVSATADETGQVMEKANEAMERIAASSSKISSIISMIDDIAFQTNLLALNASVEAARAGDAGKGFAVVAVEVRRLAQSAARASSDVKGLVEESTSQVTRGSQLVAEATEKLGTMVTGVRENGVLIEGIALASREQSTAIKEVGGAIRQMDEMTQQNAALVEQTNAAIEQTEQQVGELDRIVKVFTVSESGQFDPSARQSHAPTGIKGLQVKVQSAA